MGIGYSGLDALVILPFSHVNTITRFGIDPSLEGKGVAFGMTSRGTFQSSDSLAMPIIISGIRTADDYRDLYLAALIGAGGLGPFIFWGLTAIMPV